MAGFLLRKDKKMRFYALLQVASVTIVALTGCMSNEEYNARLENTFSIECQKAGFQLNSEVYKLCMENKRDLYKIDQRNKINSSIGASTNIPSTSESNFSFSYTVRLK